MTKVIYYQTTSDKLTKAFCLLAEKCYHTNMGVFVYTINQTIGTEFDKSLWTYSKKQFIPHGTIHDIETEKQPILIGWELKILNNPDVALLVNIEREKLLEFIELISRSGDSPFKRLLFLYDQTTALTSMEIEEIISRSAIKDFVFSSFYQDENNNWHNSKAN